MEEKLFFSRVLKVIFVLLKARSGNLVKKKIMKINLIITLLPTTQKKQKQKKNLLMQFRPFFSPHPSLPQKDV